MQYISMCYEYSNRVVHIDIARGIAIILVVLGHCCQSADMALNRVILSFHMPLFFFLSGVFAKSETAKTLLGGGIFESQETVNPTSYIVGYNNNIERINMAI